MNPRKKIAITPTATPMPIPAEAPAESCPPPFPSLVVSLLPGEVLVNELGEVEVPGTVSWGRADVAVVGTAVVEMDVVVTVLSSIRNIELDTSFLAATATDGVWPLGTKRKTHSELDWSSEVRTSQFHVMDRIFSILILPKSLVH
jgi:hypothetical protein